LNAGMSVVISSDKDWRGVASGPQVAMQSQLPHFVALTYIDVSLA